MSDFQTFDNWCRVKVGGGIISHYLADPESGNPIPGTSGGTFSTAEIWKAAGDGAKAIHIKVNGNYVKAHAPRPKAATDSPLDKLIAVTAFADYAAADKAERRVSLRAMVPLIKSTTAGAKEQLPWLKLGRFGDQSSDKNSLRHDGNVLAIGGTEADYDGGVMGIDEADTRLSDAGIAAVVYTSPSHAPEKPRWRVLCPLSKEITGTPQELHDLRAEFVGRVNGALGGVLTAESFALSQSFYFGSVNSNPAHQVRLVEGQFIDLRVDLESVGAPAASPPRPAEAFDWDQRAGTKQEMAEADIVGALSREGDRSARAATAILSLRHAGYTPNETVEALLDHAECPVMGHYGDDPDEDRVRADVQRLWEKGAAKDQKRFAELEGAAQRHAEAEGDAVEGDAAEGDAGSAEPETGSTKDKRVAIEGSIFDMAERFIRADGPEFRYVKVEKQWFHFDGAHWRRDDRNRVRERIKECLGKLSLCARGSDAYIRAIASTNTLRQIEEACQADRRITVLPDIFDTDPYMLCTPGGMVDLRTGTVRPARPDDYCRSITAVAPADPGTPHPLWDKLLDHFTQGDAELRGYLQRLTGLCVTGDNPEQVLAVIEGSTNGGKSTIFEALRNIAGDYARVAMAKTFLLDPHGRIDMNDIAEIAHARMVMTSEPDATQRWSASIIKQVCSGETIKERAVYRSGVEFRPGFTVILTCNKVPHLTEPDPAIERRLHVFPAGPTVPEAERDDKLPAKLQAEYPAILRWVIDGAVAWHKDGLKAPEAVRHNGRRYFESEDPLAEWLKERTERVPDAFTAIADLYHDYETFSRGAGYMTKALFSERLQRLQWEAPGKDGRTIVQSLTYHKRDGVRGYLGIRLLPKTEDQSRSVVIPYD